MDTDAPEVESGQRQDVDTAVVSKKSRKPRTRGLSKKLQNQVEFYFGDANLPKDKFLQQKMSEDANGFIPVQVIADFKKMRLLTGDTGLVVKAIRNSSLLELSDDSLSVRRVLPLPNHTPSDVDERTVYVENLPTPSTTHDDVKKMFKTFGDVIYVSLPRFKVSGDIKGFAFVEFSKKEEADSAVTYFKSKESTDSLSDIKPADVSCDSDAMPTRRKRKREEDADQAIEVSSTKQLKKSNKSKETEDTEITTTTQPTAQPQSTTAPEGSRQADTPTSGGGSKSSKAGPETPDDGEASVEATRKRKHDSDEDESRPSLKVARIDSQSSDTQDGGEGGKKKKKNRQHKKKSVSTSAAKEFDRLRVMSKTEWLSMKQIFKDVQKDHMKKLKEEPSSPQAKPKEERGFVGECLVKVECEDGASVERLQEVCSVFGEVAYVDVKYGEKEGFVRYKTSGCVSRLLEADQEAHPNITFHTVPDAEERAYFLKTQAERRQRHLKGKKHNQMRGQDKVINKALRRGRGYKEMRYTDKSVDKSCDKSGVKSSDPVKSKRVHIKFSDSDTEQ